MDLFDAKHRTIIRTSIERIGKGDSSQDPVRILIQYWSFDGKKILEYDTHTKQAKVFDEELI